MLRTAKPRMVRCADVDHRDTTVVRGKHLLPGPSAVGQVKHSSSCTGPSSPYGLRYCRSVRLGEAPISKRLRPLRRMVRQDQASVLVVRTQVVFRLTGASRCRAYLYAWLLSQAAHKAAPVLYVVLTQVVLRIKRRGAQQARNHTSCSKVTSH